MPVTRLPGPAVPLGGPSAAALAMTAPYLAIDFGTTSTKSALVDVDTGALVDVRHRPTGACSGRSRTSRRVGSCAELVGSWTDTPSGRSADARFLAETRGARRADLDGATLARRRWRCSPAHGATGTGAISPASGRARSRCRTTSRRSCAPSSRSTVALVPRLDPDRRRGRLVLSGGLARRLPALPGLLAAATGYVVTPPTALDESLLGLRALALVASGQAPTAAAARAAFGRTRTTGAGVR